MSALNSTSADRILNSYPPLPLEPSHWQAVAKQMKLSKQQKRIVELVLRGMGDKEVSAVLEIAEPTIRTHMTRIFAKTKAGSRMEVAMRVLQIALHTPHAY
jgi:DNA-binding NarL/FixJ family response regulator